MSAGQMARFNLQATPGVGFSGTLAFACANCSAPSVTVTNGAAVNFTVTVTTGGSAVVALTARRTFPSRPVDSTAAEMLLLILLAFWFYWRKREWREASAGAIDWKGAVALACLTLVLNGCGGGSSASSVQPPPPLVITPSGTYTLTVTPSATPAGSTKSLPISPISLTLAVK
jgi:hypothetical protein